MDGTSAALRLQQHASHAGDGFREETGVFSYEGSALLYVLVTPDREARHLGIIVCEPWLESGDLQIYELDFLRNAARSGFGGIYFQPPGTGESDGPPEELTIDVRWRSARAAARHLTAHVPSIARHCYWGIQVGAAVAALAASDDGSSVIAWDPLIDADEYWRRVMRMAAVQRMSVPTAPGQSSIEALLQREESDVLGRSVYRQQVEDFASVQERVRAVIDRLGPTLVLDASARRADVSVLSSSEPRPGGTRTPSMRVTAEPEFERETLRWLEDHS